MEFLPDSEDYGRIAMAVAIACCCSSDHSSTKMQSSANETTVLKGDRLDRGHSPCGIGRLARWR